MSVLPRSATEVFGVLGMLGEMCSSSTSGRASSHGAENQMLLDGLRETGFAFHTDRAAFNTDTRESYSNSFHNPA